jgi:hypothetical protein
LNVCDVRGGEYKNAFSNVSDWNCEVVMDGREIRYPNEKIRFERLIPQQSRSRRRHHHFTRQSSPASGTKSGRSHCQHPELRSLMKKENPIAEGAALMRSKCEKMFQRHTWQCEVSSQARFALDFDSFVNGSPVGVATTVFAGHSIGILRTRESLAVCGIVQYRLFLSFSRF